MSDGEGSGLHRLPVGVGVIQPRDRRDSIRASRADAFHGKLIEHDEAQTESVHEVRPQWMLSNRPSSRAPNASVTRNGSKLRSSAFGSLSVDLIFDIVRLHAWCMVHIKHPARALAPAQSGRLAAGLWRNAGTRVAWLASRQFA